jgi:hypothetical protein
MTDQEKIAWFRYRVEWNPNLTEQSKRILRQTLDDWEHQLECPYLNADGSDE